jgi:hypothetical protein
MSYAFADPRFPDIDGGFGALGCTCAGCKGMSGLGYTFDKPAWARNLETKHSFPFLPADAGAMHVGSGLVRKWGHQYAGGNPRRQSFYTGYGAADPNAIPAPSLAQVTSNMTPEEQAQAGAAVGGMVMGGVLGGIGGVVVGLLIGWAAWKK